jgi:hypothetical protein
MNNKANKGSILMVALTAVLFCPFVVGQNRPGTRDAGPSGPASRAGGRSAGGKSASPSGLLFVAAKGGWFGWGDGYYIGEDRKNYHSKSPSCYISSSGWPEGYGMIFNHMGPRRFVGKRVRMSAYIKTERVTEWAGMMMRLDGKKQNDFLGFDNMHERPIQGTTEWQRYEIVLDVPKGAKNLVFGMLLTGPGKAWLDDVKLDVVGSNVPPTGN